MPYQPAVTPDASPLERGAAALGAGFGERNERIRQEREKNEAADVTLEHLHSASPELLEPWLRSKGDMETPSAELLGRFLGSSTRAKKEALIGAAAADALMKQRKLQQGLETVQVGNEGMRIAQQGQAAAEQRRQFNEEQKRLRTTSAMSFADKARDRREQAKVNVVTMPNGETMVTNGSGNFSVRQSPQPGTQAPPPWAASAMANDSTLYWTGDALRAKPAAQPSLGPVPGAAAPGSPSLPPLPQKHRTPEDVRNDGSLSREQKAQILRAEFGFK